MQESSRRGAKRRVGKKGGVIVPDDVGGVDDTRESNKHSIVVAKSIGGDRGGEGEGNVASIGKNRIQTSVIVLRTMMEGKV